ncbi:MAG TPA: SWIM zinc finger family protein, partial [Anaerolineales bacterium]|nr:SWIM zinc finger family protein [Anaerolineales bacterium]
MPAQLTEDIIRALSTPQSFERGQQYYRAGAVFNTSRQEDLLFGECEGSMASAYRLRVELDEGGVRAAFCTCPYEMGGYCKHVVALLLAFLYTPEEFTERSGIVEMLAGLSHEDLLGLIHKMVEHDPNLYDWLEMAIPFARTSSKAEESPPKEKRQTQVSAKAYQRQTRNILHSLDGYRMSEAYWMMGGMVEELAQVVDSAEAFLQAGDAEGAITILMVLLEEVADCYEQSDDSNGELGGF